MLLTSQQGVQLSQSSGSENGTTYSADVYSIRAQSRRKRSELAIAFDNKLELYDISNATRIKEYSIPDQESVTCAPASIRHKRSDGATKRLSYVASVQGNRSRIHGRIEDAKAVADLSKPSWNSKSRDNPIISLEICESREGDDLGLLVVFKNGECKLLSEDLKTEFWSITASSTHEEIRNVFMLSLEQARNGILKSRDDVLAKLEALNIVHVVMFIVQSTQEGNDGNLVQLQSSVYAVQPALQSSSALGASTGMESVLTQTIPVPDGLTDSKPLFHLHRASGRLLQQGQKSLALYNLTTPNILLEKVTPINDMIQSAVQLASTTIALMTHKSLLVLDTKFGSVKASITLDASDSQEKDVARNTNSNRLLAYFAPSSTIVSLQSRSLILYRLSSNKDQQNARKSIRDSTLAEAMSRGISIGTNTKHSHVDTYVPAKFGTLITSQAEKDDWPNVRKQLSKAVKEDKVEEFDTLARNHFGLDDETKDLLRNDRTKIHAILSILFKTSAVVKGTDNSQHTLRLKMVPPMTTGWLVHDGHFNQREIELAMKHYGKLQPTENLVDCAMIDAIHTYDPSLQTLLFLLSSPIILSANEIGKTILNSLQVLQQAHNLANKTKLLTAGADEAAASDTDMEVTNGPNGRSPSHSPSPEPESEKVHDAHALMRVCLSRLTTFLPHEIQAAFRTTFSTSSLIAFIDYLRLDLASGGWFSHHENYDDPNVDDNVSQPSDYMRTVSVLMSAAVDSLGTAGWLGSADNVAERVMHMNAEVTVALEGIEEATYLHGLLNEVLLYAKHKPLPPTKLTSEAERKKRKIETDATTISANGMEMIKPVTIGLGEGQSNALPIGLKPVGSGKLESTERISAGGEVKKRSLRDIGRLKSMQVGAYSFERIMI